MGSNRIAMQKIRAEKEFIVRWSGILTNGQPDSLEDRDLSLYLINPYGAESRQEMAVEGNTVTFRVYADTCKAYGQYRLKLYENKGKVGQTVLDQCEGFCIVATTCQEGGITQGLDLDTIELSGGDMAIGIQGRSAYEIAVANGFEGTEAEWLASLKGEKGDIGPQGPEGEKGDKGDKGDIGEAFTYSDFTPEQIAELQRPASEAAQLANQAASKANAAAESATRAAQTATQTETAIKQAEALRVTAEKQRETNESEREQAETSRKQAESGRVTAEQGRVSAESGRVAAESGRVSAEQQRVTEFATLKQESETATTNANEAAEKANEVAEGIESNLYNTEKYGTYNVINNDTNQRNYFSKDKIIFNAKPTVSSCVYFDKNGNHYDLPILGLATEQKKPEQCNSYIGYYCSGYYIKFLHKENGEIKTQKTYGDIRQPILNGFTFNMLTKIFACIDIFGKVALLFGYTAADGVVELCKEPIENVSDIFNESYLIIGTRDYTSKIYNIYISLNFPISYKTFLNEEISIGNYNIGKRYSYNKYANSPIVGNGTVYAESGTVEYKEQSTGHCIANVIAIEGKYSTFAGEVTNIPSGISGSSFTVRFKILSGQCTIIPGTSEIYQITDDHDFVRINKLVCDMNKEYTLVYFNYSSDHAYIQRYSTKMSGTFKVEILDVKAYFAQSQICCMETFNGTFFMGNIPMSCFPNNISYNTPAVILGSPQGILGQIYIGSESAFITLKDSSGNFVYKKITP